MRFLSYFSIRLPINLVYMLQQVEYEPAKFIDWLKRLPNLDKVMYRKQLVFTKKALALVFWQYLLSLIFAAIVGTIAASIGLIWVLLILIFPLVNLVGLLMAVMAGQIISRATFGSQIQAAQTIFNAHKGVKVAILGSYGKTTMKELLFTVLNEGKKVKATPGNKNVAISHARWAKKLSGDEDVLLIEFGEAKPGDIAEFARNTSPNTAVITGLAPNHLDKYQNLEALKEDLGSIGNFVKDEKIYLNADAKSISDKFVLFGEAGTEEVKISGVKVAIDGMKFTATLKSGETISLTTDLVGRHLLGPLALCMQLALKLGLDKTQIKTGIAKTKPFEHRLQPRQLSGAWIIDDTYNGSLEGFRAGLRLLKELPATRKIYVTPGLVDQGVQNEAVHQEIGKLIAEAKPDKVILFKNSVSSFIMDSLKNSKFQGEIEVQTNALEFYTNLEHTLASGDLVLLQNDWTDNYA